MVTPGSRRHRGQRASGVVVARADRASTETLYEEARQSRARTEKFMLDGRHTGTGGGNHVTLGGATPADSPLLRRPDLLQSLITYWQNHPALSYLFSGMFIGPTSQAPRVDEARDDRLYELEIAFQQTAAQERRPGSDDAAAVARRPAAAPSADRPHRQHASRRVLDRQAVLARQRRPAASGLLEFRAFEMPPHRADERSCRCCCCARWSRGSGGSRTAASSFRWGTALHDRWLLPHFVAADIRDVVADLNAFGYAFDAELVRSVRRVPLSALRHGRPTTASRSSCGRRSSRGTCWARR